MRLGWMAFAMAALAITAGCEARRPASGDGANTDAGGAGGAASSSASGEPACSSCWSYLQSEAPPESLCGFDAATQSCAASSSCARVIELSTCVCGGEPGGGQCVTFCELSCTGIGIDDGCEECMEAVCGAAYDACVADSADE